MMTNKEFQAKIRAVMLRNNKPVVLWVYRQLLKGIKKMEDLTAYELL